MKNRTLPLSMARNAVLSILLLAVAGFANLHAQPQGAINGLFSVSECRQVYFSQGNLQYQASTDTWRFAETQYGYVGTDNSNISPTYDGWIDLFGWGTSGYDHGAVCYQPWSISSVDSDYYAYGQGDCHLYDQTGLADWGCNAISNGGNQENSGWRTLTRQEWNYVLCLRNGSRYAMAKVNNVPGLILLPDGWSGQYYLKNINTSTSSFTDNTITASNWLTLEQYGAVFLPAAGRRGGTGIGNAPGQTSPGGYYWSSSNSNYNYNNPYNLIFFDKHVGGVFYGFLKSNGFSVRLVCTVQNKVCVTPNPSVGGIISGDGAYEVGEDCTLTATASEGYTFVNWMENGEVVSTENTYSFTVTGMRSLVANFKYSNSNVTNGVLCGQFSVSANEQVHFSQGNLQYIGSAETPCWKFAEHQWDYLGDNGQGGDSQTENRDLFSWGTSGYDHGAAYYQPWNINGNASTDYCAYGKYNYNINDQTGWADWGFNAIINGGNQENCGWRTLTNGEWNYVLNTRSTSSGIRYAKACVNNVNGLILLPDDWSSSYYTLYSTNQGNANYNKNIISASQWNTLEQHGAVFLPAAFGPGFDLYANERNMGLYSSASYNNRNSIYCISYHTESSNLSPYSFSNNRSKACSVRLVFSDHNYSYSPTINAIPNPLEGGQVSGVGIYEADSECVLTASANTGYTFLNWTEDGEVVSSNTSYSFTVRSDKTLVANFVYSDANNTNGALCGRFSVNANQQILFSQGNLQYIGSADSAYWKFADHQWDFFGVNNQSSDLQTVIRDLFGWGTSGYNHGAVCYQPWSTSPTKTSYKAYGQVSYNLFNQTGQADWGYNAIANGGNQENSGWYTLKVNDWVYLFNTRNTVSGIRYAKANVNNVNGVILLPDDWDASYYSLENVNLDNAIYNANVITGTQWRILEQHGAVFLPSAGYRSGTNVNSNSIGVSGNYWSSTRYNDECAYFANITTNTLNPQTYSSSYRYYGYSVRLVRNAPCEIGVVSNPSEGGTINGGGTYDQGSTATLTAVANPGFTFVNWMENGDVVSTNVSYSFTVTTGRSLVANFINSNANITNGALGGHFSVGDYEQVQFSQGNLQYIGSASPRYWKFAEHQWDHLGDNGQGSTSQTANRDLFCWGTSGYNHGAVFYQPWNLSDDVFDASNCYAYGQSYYNLYDQTGQADWGYNAISNGGNQVNSGWRTLKKDEWLYLLHTRNTASGLRYAKACVNNVNGLVLLPDDWSNSYYSLNNPNENNADYGSNILSVTQWNILEQHGAVFLPTTGYREGMEVLCVEDSGFYWMSSNINEGPNCCVEFSDQGGLHYLGYCSSFNWHISVYGLSVRLVRPTQYAFGINATPSPAEGGVVTGGGLFEEGQMCTLSATPNAGYTFVNWTEGTTVVSNDATYSFMVTGHKNLVANFEPITNHWTTTNFKNYKIVKGVIFIDGEEQFSDVLEIGAFCGEECRATSLASFFPVTNQYIVNLNIGSNLDSPNESIVFRIYDHAQHQELNLESNNNLVLTNFNPIGSLNNWFHFSFTQEMAVSVSITPEGAGIITGIGNFFSGTVVTLEAMANNGFSFKRWSMGGQVVSMENPYSFTITEPVELTAEFDYQQIDQLAVGWNWWSTFIEMNGIDGLTMLEGSLGHDGEMIVGQGVNVENYYSQIGYDYWWGDVFQIQNEKGYKISVSSPCEITMKGAKCNQEDHPVTINQNWNWIGYPCINQQSITSVSLQASNEDMIVGQGPISTYYEGYGWWPDFVLEPGKAYLYYSTSESTKEMVFLNNSKESLLKTNTNSTKHNTQLYPDVICVFAKVYLYGEEIKDETIELGAFVGDECRGSVRLMYFEPRDSFYAAFTVFGQDNEVVKFRIVNSEGDLTSNDCPSNILFKANSIFGSLSNPMQLRFGATEEQQIMRGVQVYPNPVGKNNDYCVVIPSDETMTETIIYNSFGVAVGHEYGAIDISAMKALSVSGIYMIEVRCLSGNIYRNKLIVK